MSQPTEKPKASQCIDLSHTLSGSEDGRSSPADSPSPLVRFAARIVSFANLIEPDTPHLSHLSCRRRPGRRPCSGMLEICRQEPETGIIRWRCTTCSDHGKVIGWKNTRLDLSDALAGENIISLIQRRANRSNRNQCRSTAYLELKVDLLSGPVDLDAPVTRRIRVGSRCSLLELHQIFNLIFDRREDEPYEFMFGAPYDPGAKRYTGNVEHPEDATAAATECQNTLLQDLQLKPDDTFGYLFDFGEEWIHCVSVIGIETPTDSSLADRSDPGIPAAGTHTSKITLPLGTIPELPGHFDAELLAARGSSPPQHPVDDAWDGELEDTYLEESVGLLSEVYGTYCPEKTPDPDVWRSMDELEQLLLVVESHRSQDISAQVGVPTGTLSLALHALIHVYAESAISNQEPKAERFVKNHRSPSSSRHEMIHELGMHLVVSALNPTTELKRSYHAQIHRTSTPPQP